MSFDKDYLDLVLEINKNLRSQLEVLYKLLRTKIKVEVKEDNNKLNRLENILNELEILKTSLSFNMQKQVNVVKHIKNESSVDHKEEFNKHLKEKQNTITHLENKVDSLIKENMLLNDRNLEITKELEHVKRTNDNSNLTLLEEKNQLDHLNKQLEEEKTKNRNLVNLIKELEKRKSNLEDKTELTSQIDFLNCKLKDLDLKYRRKIEKKDLIIKNLDQSLVEYEEKLNSFIN